jgi:twinkle protein
MFAQMHNVIIFLVAHPTKMQKTANGLYASPSLYDVSGSADFRNQTHDGFSIYRFFGDDDNDSMTVFENLKTKMKFQGEIGGKVEFEYHLPSGRYYEKGTSAPTFILCDEETEPIEAEIPLVPFNQMQNIFDSPDEVPF